ncbi:MAG: transporter substrate-binding domain-containing protein [Dehalococcoidia bacterium]
MYGRRRVVFVALLVALGVALLAPAEATPARAAARPDRVPATIEVAQATTPLRVAIKPLDPFVVKTGDRYSGFSIELWDEIARRNGWTTEYVWYETLPPMLLDVDAGKVDVGIAGISITREREALLDFSYPMFNAGLQILAVQHRDVPWYSRIGTLLSPTAGLYLLGLILAIFVAGNVVHLFQRELSYARGLARGMFRAAAVGLVGEVGEQERPLSQFASVLWVILGIAFVSMFTASLTTELTVQQITGGITGVRDLPGKRVVTVEGSTAARFLTERRIAFDGLPTVEAAFERLDRGSADAMVFDAPVLQHHLQVTGADHLILVGNVFQREDYGIAMPTGSPLRKTVNQSLLEMRVDGTYDRIHNYYFGPTR